MLWGSPASQRTDALDAKVEAVSGRLDEMTSRLDQLTTGFERLSSDLHQARERLDAEASSRREQSVQLATMRNALAELQVEGKATSNHVAKLRGDSRTVFDAVEQLRSLSATTWDVQERGRTTSDTVAEQASLLADLQERHRQQGQSLDQIRADVIRIERQAAADLAELRTTNEALARVVLRADAPDAGRP